MTILQENTLKELKNTKPKYNIGKAMRKGGYAYSTSRSGMQYAIIRRQARKLGYYSPERIEKDEETVWKKADSAGDITNQCRLIEGRRKVAGMITEKSEVDNKNPDKVIIVYDKTSTEKTSHPL